MDHTVFSNLKPYNTMSQKAITLAIYSVVKRHFRSLKLSGFSFILQHMLVFTIHRKMFMIQVQDFIDRNFLVQNIDSLLIRYYKT